MPSNSTATHERAYEFMNGATELRMLFSIVGRLAENPPDHHGDAPNEETDPDLKYIAYQGERLAAKLSENLDNFSMDLSRAKEVHHD